jgi:hypothetical protein
MNLLNKKPKKTNRVNTGVATNDLIFSAYQEPNDEVFPRILSLYVSAGGRIADVTWGKGVFWKWIDTSQYRLLRSDLKVDVARGVTGGVDARMLPYESNSIDAVVFDPPYMHTPRVARLTTGIRISRVTTPTIPLLQVPIRRREMAMMRPAARSQSITKPF